MSDLIAQLREEQNAGWHSGLESLFKDAADEIERLMAELAEARRTAEFWKANHLEGNKEIDALKLSQENLLKAQPAQSEPVAWIYTFDGHSQALLPEEVEEDAFKLNPELYRPLFTTPQPSAEAEHIMEKVNQAIPYINASTHGGAKAIRILETAIAMKKGK